MALCAYQTVGTNLWVQLWRPSVIYMDFVHSVWWATMLPTRNFYPQGVVLSLLWNQGPHYAFISFFKLCRFFFFFWYFYSFLGLLCCLLSFNFSQLFHYIVILSLITILLPTPFFPTALPPGHHILLQSLLVALSSCSTANHVGNFPFLLFWFILPFPGSLVFPFFSSLLCCKIFSSNFPKMSMLRNKCSKLLHVWKCLHSTFTLNCVCLDTIF